MPRKGDDGSVIPSRSVEYRRATAIAELRQPRLRRASEGIHGPLLRTDAWGQRPPTMERVTGIGGIFFKAKNPKQLLAWYREHLGIDCTEFSAIFRWQDDPRAGTAMTVWSPFSEERNYFAPSQATFMINFRVRDLDAMLAQIEEPRRGGR